jgi:hypothetical protein
MLESIIASKRLPALTEILNRFSTLEIQSVYNKVFNALERRFLQERFAKQGLAKAFRMKHEFEQLPENWFRENK